MTMACSPITIDMSKRLGTKKLQCLALWPEACLHAQTTWTQCTLRHTLAEAYWHQSAVYFCSGFRIPRLVSAMSEQLLAMSFRRATISELAPIVTACGPFSSMLCWSRAAAVPLPFFSSITLRRKALASLMPLIASSQPMSPQSEQKPARTAPGQIWDCTPEGTCSSKARSARCCQTHGLPHP